VFLEGGIVGRVVILWLEVCEAEEGGGCAARVALEGALLLALDLLVSLQPCGSPGFSKNSERVKCGTPQGRGLLHSGRKICNCNYSTHHYCDATCCCPDGIMLWSGIHYTTFYK